MRLLVLSSFQRATSPRQHASSSDDEEVCVTQNKQATSLKTFHNVSTSSSVTSLDEFSILAGIQGYHHSQTEIEQVQIAKISFEKQSLPSLFEVETPNTSYQLYIE